MTRQGALVSPPAAIVALCGVSIAVLFVAISLLGSDGDPSGVARFGELTPQQTEYAEALLGRQVFVRDNLGRDGEFFFIHGAAGISTHADVPWGIVVVPAALAVMWAGYVRWRISFAQDVIENEEITSVPLSGAIQAISSGRAGLIDVLSIALLVMLAIGVPLMAFRTQNLLMWGAVPFSVLALFLTIGVWQ